MKISGFDILEKVGEGGMAVVWKAHQVSLDRIVAIKILRPQFASDPEEVKDFIQEARSAAKLKHPNIIHVYDVAEQDGIYYFVMEYVSGSTVGHLLRKQGSIPQKKALAITRYMAEALEHAWNRSTIIHRDIKPDNIMIDEDGTVKLADLGLAKMVDSASLSAQLQRGKIEGTPNYISPEQAKCTIQLDCRTDMYSLGATLYHMVTGKMPFAEDDPLIALNKHVTGHLPNPRDINPSISLGVAQLITRLMMKNPRDRYKDWPEAIQQIKKTASGRMLLGKEGADAASTIEPLKTRTTSTVTRRQPVHSIPLWVRLPAWALLLTWLAFLAHHQIKAQHVPWLTEKLVGKLTAQKTTVQHIRQSPEATSARDEGRRSAVSVPLRETTPARIGREEEKEQHTANEEEQLLHAFKINVARCLIEEEFDKAVAIIEQELEYAHSRSFETEMDNMKQLVDDISDMNNLIASSFRANVGRKVVIHHNNQDRTIILRSIIGDKVSADLVSRVGTTTLTKPATFSLARLDPLERSRWLGNADTPDKCAMKFILHMRGGDYKTAREYASKCGLLSDVFTKEVESTRQE